MSFTSNSWKKSGGVNRTKNNNFISSQHMTPKNIDVTQKLGSQNTTIPTHSNLSVRNESLIYNLRKDNITNNNITLYYPLNDLSYNGNLPSQTTNTSIKNQTNNIDVISDYPLYLQDISNIGIEQPYVKLSNVPFETNQNCIQFRNNSKTAIADKNYNTSNIYGTANNNNSITVAMTFDVYIYVPSGCK